MAVHIDEVTSEVTAETEPARTAATSGDDGVSFTRVLDRFGRWQEDRRRIAAEGFDD